MSDSTDDIPPDTPEGNADGHGTPPLTRRFKKSGNPKGRPAGSKNRKTIIRQVAQQKHSVTEDGKKVQRTTLELVSMQLRNTALLGENKQAVTEFHKWLDKCEPPSPNPNAGVLVAPAQISAEEWIEQAERSNALKEEPVYRNSAEVAEFQRGQSKKG
jgi:hypothetical protein